MLSKFGFDVWLWRFVLFRFLFLLLFVGIRVGCLIVGGCFVCLLGGGGYFFVVGFVGWLFFFGWVVCVGCGGLGGWGSD